MLAPIEEVASHATCCWGETSKRLDRQSYASEQVAGTLAQNCGSCGLTRTASLQVQVLVTSACDD